METVNIDDGVVVPQSERLTATMFCDNLRVDTCVHPLMVDALDTCTHTRCAIHPLKRCFFVCFFATKLLWGRLRRPWHFL